MRLPTVLALALAIAPAVAGCLAPDPVAQVETASATLPADWYRAALAREEGHNHSALEEHLNASTPNFKVLGHDPLLADAYGGKPAWPYGCGDIATRPDDGRRIALAAGFVNDLVFALVDVTDPADPVKVGEFYSKGMRAWDAAMTPDARFALIAFTGQPRVPGEAIPVLSYRTACGQGDISIPLTDAAEVGPDIAITNGLVLVDISDPTKPVYADWEPTPGRNMHSVSSASIDNETWVMASVLGGASVPLPVGPLPVRTPSHATSYVAFDQIVETPLGFKLVRVSTVDVPVTVPSEGSPVVPIGNGHVDAVMQRHPIDGKVYAYIANWEGGAITVDMSNPRVPVPVGQWMPPHENMVNPAGDGPCYLTAVHGVMPAPEAWDGKHYYFAGQECPTKVDESKPGGSVFIVDNTDPTNPITVGSWHPPEDTGVWTAVYQASPHYTAISGRTMYVSLYHGGVWAVDLSDASKFDAPPSIGVFMPHLPPAAPVEGEHNAPAVEQVDAYPDGLVVVVENGSGVYTLDFDETDPAPPASPYAYG